MNVLQVIGLSLTIGMLFLQLPAQSNPVKAFVKEPQSRSVSLVCRWSDPHPPRGCIDPD